MITIITFSIFLAGALVAYLVRGISFKKKERESVITEDHRKEFEGLL